MPVQSLSLLGCLTDCQGCHAMHLAIQDEEILNTQAQVRRTEVMCLAESGAKIQSRKFPLISGKHRKEVVMLGSEESLARFEGEETSGG